MFGQPDELREKGSTEDANSPNSPWEQPFLQNTGAMGRAEAYELLGMGASTVAKYSSLAPKRRPPRHEMLY